MKALVGVLKFIAVVAFFGVLLALPTMWLWNLLIPTLFGIAKINLWQAWGVNILTGVLFRKRAQK